MNEIKVTVSYEKPTTSKFDALMAEYEAAKKYADETVAYYKPLADMAEEAKFDAIMTQLETIKEYAKRISDLHGQGVWITVYISDDVRGGGSSSLSNGKFSVVYRPNNGFEITWYGDRFTKERLKKYPSGMCQGYYNIIGKWNEWRVYELLEEEAIFQLRRQISIQKSKAQEQINRLNNITKGGN
jgi:hypothetical protein